MNGPALALAVAGAGGAGSALRFAVDLTITERSRVPWALLVINVTGSFALGLLTGLSGHQTWHAVVGTGFLGGYTTFSTASADAALRWLEGGRTDGLRAAAVMALACVAAASLGAYLA
ncbi:MAG: CrcB family protein [Aeromicrobium sp.]|uniref:fluoride efflux transporter FluC n=1 Tax=Aeromicrobium sp. TaxID=1871063 RepID=UPI0039E50E2D